MESNEPKAYCRLSKDKKYIELDEITTLEDLPSDVLNYKLGNRSGIEWVLDQYRPKKPKDATIAAKFDSYKFSAYKNSVIDLIERVVTVSLRSNELVQKLR